MRLTAATLLALCLGCSRPPAPLPVVVRPELALEGVTLRVYRDSQPQLLARADRLELMRSTGDLAATQVHFDFLVDALTVDAPALSGNLVTLAFDVEGGVALRTLGPDAVVGRTASAHFEAKQGQHGVATGRQHVTFEGLRDGRAWELNASRFWFDVAQQHLTFEPVQSRVSGP